MPGWLTPNPSNVGVCMGAAASQTPTSRCQLLLFPPPLLLSVALGGCPPAEKRASMRTLGRGAHGIPEDP